MLIQKKLIDSQTPFGDYVFGPRALMALFLELINQKIIFCFQILFQTSDHGKWLEQFHCLKQATLTDRSHKKKIFLLLNRFTFLIKGLEQPKE